MSKGKTETKTLLLIAAGLAAAGVAIYLLMRGREDTYTGVPEDVAPSSGASSNGFGVNLGSVSTGFMNSFDPWKFDSWLHAPSADFGVVAPTPTWGNTATNGGTNFGAVAPAPNFTLPGDTGSAGSSGGSSWMDFHPDPNPFNGL